VTHKSLRKAGETGDMRSKSAVKHDPPLLPEASSGDVQAGLLASLTRPTSGGVALLHRLHAAYGNQAVGRLIRDGFGIGIATRTDRPLVLRVVDYSGPTIGVEQELTSGQKVVIPNPLDRGRLGVVKKNGQELVEFTSDIGGGPTNEYTIELRTTPAVKSSKAAIDDRQLAMKIIVGAILRAGARDGPVVPGTFEEFEIQIEKANHRIKLADRSASTERANESISFANQASTGLKTRDLLQCVSPEAVLVLNHATWYNSDLKAELAPAHLNNADHAQLLYSLIASVIIFLAKTVDRFADRPRL